MVFEGINKEDCEIKLYEISISLGFIDLLKIGNKVVWLGVLIFLNNDLFFEIMECVDSVLFVVFKIE